MLTGLRVVTTSATAIVQGLVRTLLNGGAHDRIALQIGDEAPDGKTLVKVTPAGSTRVRSKGPV